MNQPDPKCYVSRCPRCNGITFAAVDLPDISKDTANEIARLIREGRPVDRVELSVPRTGPWCGGPKKCATTLPKIAPQKELRL